MPHLRLIVLCAAFALAGCASPSRWEVGFRPEANAPEAQHTAKTRFQWANYDALAEGKILDGYSRLGTTAFRDEPIDEREFVKGSRLEAFALEIGADTVLLGRKSAGTESRIRHIRTVGPGRGADPGDPTAGGSTVESIPYQTEVPVMDYIAVFLRAKGPSAE